MKLYYYEHCPYCIRVLMLIAYKHMDIELCVLSNDDETTPTSMIGKKMLPILVKDDGTFLPESLDIIQYLDHLDAPVLQGEFKLDPEVQTLVDTMHQDYRMLVWPRMAQPIYQEFQTAAARDYFTTKKQVILGSFAEHIANTDDYIKNIMPPLQRLGDLLPQEKHVLSDQDILVFPKLHLLQLVEELRLPETMQRYLQRIHYADIHGVSL